MKYTEEEKKAIEDLKKLKIGIEFLNNYLKSNGNYENIDNTDIASIDIILNLIEKQRKEIEEKDELLKFNKNYINRLEQDLFGNASNYVVPKEKIREKIKELSEEDRTYTDELSEPDSNFKIIDKNLKRIKNQTDILKELLGE